MRDIPNTAIPKGFNVRYLPARRAVGSRTWERKGGMMGGRGGSCNGVTGGNGLGIVPAAFRVTK